jgi:hypothetical protein
MEGMTTSGRMAVNTASGMGIAISVMTAIPFLIQGNIFATIGLVWPTIVVAGFVLPGYPWGKFLDRIVGPYDDEISTESS